MQIARSTKECAPICTGRCRIGPRVTTTQPATSATPNAGCHHRREYPRILEADHEREQVETERKDPQKRDYADVLAELVGRGEQHDGRAGGEPEPQQLLAWGRRCRRPHLDARRAPPARGSAGGACQRESAVGP